MTEERNTGADNAENEDNQDDNQGDDQKDHNQDEGQKKSSDNNNSNDDVKEQNRKGYEFRHQKRPGDEIDAKKLKDEIKQEIKTEIAEKEAAKQIYSGITDEEFDDVKTYATAKGISVKEALERPYFKSYFKEIEVRGRVDNATKEPGNRGGESGASDGAKLSDKFMNTSFPPGFSPKQ
jgi:hypothetical protein